MDGPVDIVQPEWWLDHFEELLAAMGAAAEMPGHDIALTPWRSSRMTVESPQWALEHPDELRAELEAAARGIDNVLDRAEIPERDRDDQGHEL